MRSERSKPKKDTNNFIGAGLFKTHCLQLIDQVNQTRTPLVITKHGKPLAKLLPFEEEPVSLHGCMKDTVVVHGNIVESTGEIWEADNDA
jgi:antitoxin (DNA-binding transcriptional repressor) of toxin-antitoxin stability system